MTRRKTGPFSSDGHSMYIIHTSRRRRPRRRKQPNMNSKVVTRRLDRTATAKCVDCARQIFPTKRRNKSTGVEFTIRRCGPCWESHQKT